MATTFQDILDRARALLADTEATDYRYTSAHLLVYAREAERAAAALLPPEATPALWAKTSANINSSISTFTLPLNLSQIAYMRMWRSVAKTSADPVFFVPQEQQRMLDENVFYVPSATFRVVVLEDGHLKMKPNPNVSVTDGFEMHYQKIPVSGALGDNLSVPDIVGDALAHYVAAMAHASDRDAEEYTREMAVYTAMLGVIGQKQAVPLTVRRLKRT